MQDIGKSFILHVSPLLKNVNYIVRITTIIKLWLI